jgi:hypothetical protein
MPKVKICSYDHFKRLCKSFSKLFLKQIEDNRHIQKYKSSLKEFYYGDPDDFMGDFFRLLVDLKRSFGRNPYKPCSGFTHKNVFYEDDYIANIDHCKGADVKIWVSYTVEDEKFRCIRDNNFIDNFITFRVFLKVSNHRKKLICRWRVKIDWIK